MTAAEKRHLSRVQEMGCLICGGQAEIHHIRSGQGMSQRASNFDVLPLCPTHHRLGPFGEAVHNGAKTFAEKYGTERELLEKVNRRIGR